MINILTIAKKERFLLPTLFVEMWESFSIYGMRALLVLYLVSQLGFSDVAAYNTYSLFSAFTYMLPVFAGILADRITGFKSPVLIGSIVMCFGHFIMTFINYNANFVYLGLGLIATGAGLFKGNLSSLLAACYPKDKLAQDRGFTFLYMSVNIGGLAATLGCGYVAHLFGWDYGFGLAGIFMLIGTIHFIKYKHILQDIGNPPDEAKVKKKLFLGLDLLNIVFIASIALSALFALMLNYSDKFTSLLNISGIFFLIALGFVIYKCNVNERKNLIVLIVLNIFFLLIFAIEIHLGSLINLFTERNVDKVVFGITIPAATLQGLNPALIVIFGPMIAKCFGKKQKPFLRFFLGLALMFLCFLLLYIGCITHNAQYQSHIMYLFLAMLAMALTELLVAPLLFSLCNILSPNRIKGFMMGVIMLSIAYASLVGGIISKYLAVPTNNIAEDNALNSLLVYKEGFLHISYAYLILVVLFIVAVPILRRLLLQTGEMTK